MADSRDTAQERTEQATPRRLQQARERGQVARSRELTTTTILLASAAGLSGLGPHVVEGIADVMRASFELSPLTLAYGPPIPDRFQAAVITALVSLAPFLALMAMVAALAPMSLGGWSFSSQAVSFKWEKLDPVKGLKRVFSWNGLMELSKALAKFVLVSGTAMIVLWASMDELLSISHQPLLPALGRAAELVAWSFFALSSATLVVAFFDVPFQLWNHGRQLRMTRQEVKDEFKDTEGKPEVKARLRALQREVAQRRMMEAVPTADVVVTNPHHYAVALRYLPGKMTAPRLVAKGADLVAARIREVAGEHLVPLVSSPLLARAIYFNTRINHEIPVGLYVAVAQVLAYVMRLREYDGRGTMPSLDDDLPIPDDLKK